MNLDFVPMNQAEFDAYLEHIVDTYAKDLKEYNNTLEGEPYEIAKEEIEAIIPQGLETPHNYIFKIMDTDRNKKVGHIWYIYNPNDSKNSMVGFLADIFIDKEERNQGYGTATLKKIESELKKLGAAKIVLHVFKHNPKAKKLYERLGYKVKEKVNTGYRMLKVF